MEWGRCRACSQRAFLRQVSPELASSFNDVASQQDVALYGGLCALASFDRAELKSKLIDNGALPSTRTRTRIHHNPHTHTQRHPHPKSS